jgi:hypothetical protein
VPPIAEPPPAAAQEATPPEAQVAREGAAQQRPANGQESYALNPASVIPGAPVDESQLSRAATEEGTGEPADAVFNQGVPRTPEEAFGFDAPSSVDQTYLDEFEKPPKRSGIWIGLAAAALALVAVVVFIAVTREESAEEPTPEPPVAERLAPGAEPEHAALPTEPETPQTALQPEPETTPASSPEVGAPVAEPKRGGKPAPAVAAEPPRRAKAKEKLPGAELETPAAPSLDAIIRKAKRLYDKGRLKPAINEYKKALAIDETNDLVHARLGTAYFDQDQNNLAIQHLKRAIELNGRNGQALVILGNVYQAMGNNPKAKEMYQRYLNVEPNGKFAADVRLILNAL